MIFSENRFPLFRIMLAQPAGSWLNSPRTIFRLPGEEP
jgi:hypothetical protein